MIAASTSPSELLPSIAIPLSPVCIVRIREAAPTMLPVSKFSMSRPKKSFGYSSRSSSTVRIFTWKRCLTSFHVRALGITSASAEETNAVSISPSGSKGMILSPMMSRS